MRIRIARIGTMIGMIGLLLMGSRSLSAQSAWTPNDWAKEETLKLCTNDPGEGEYCFKVWLVVVDSDVYVRLGSKAADRMNKNATGMSLPVEIGGNRFEHVRAMEAPDYVERVGKAIGEKYWSDVFVHLMNHPLTLRLRPEDAAASR